MAQAQPTTTSIVDRGLEDVVALSSKICSIVDGVLSYGGYTITDLVENVSFEEVIHLLWYGELPTPSQLGALKKEFAANFVMPKETISMLEKAPVKEKHPMSVLRTAVSYLAFYDKDSDDISEAANFRKAKRLVPQVTCLAAAIGRLRKGQKPIDPDNKLDVAGNFLYMLNGKKPSETESKFFDQCLTLHADHELNASTWAARVTAATLSDMHSAITSGVGTL
ncbi:MAG TPA: citrate/2-methylcitrate synthase, partial [Bdellovibrionota bacterium]|nr:citrate/2-methylcitrate synthase [Bdellovibrionota bacterium]